MFASVDDEPTVTDVEDLCAHGIHVLLCDDPLCDDPLCDDPLCDDAVCDDSPPGPLVDLEQAPGARMAVQLQIAGEMAGLLSRVDVLDVVEAAERQMRWVEGLRTRMLAEFHARHPADTATAPPGAGESGRVPSRRWVPTEVGLTLQLSRLEALGLVERARRFVEVLPDTLAELEAGRIDVRRADAIARATAVLPDDKARQVEARVLPKAHDATPRQLQDRVRRAVARIDPDGEYRRHKEADRGRRVSIRSLEDGMASLWFYGSAAEVEAAWQSADRLARSLGADDPRTLDQRRFDLSMQILQGRLTVNDRADLEAALTEILAQRDAADADDGADGAGTADGPNVDSSDHADADHADADGADGDHADADPVDVGSGGAEDADDGDGMDGTAESDSRSEPDSRAEPDSRSGPDPDQPYRDPPDPDDPDQPEPDPPEPDPPGTATPTGPTPEQSAQDRSARSRSAQSRAGQNRSAQNRARSGARISTAALAAAVAEALSRRPDPHAAGRRPLVQVVVGIDTLMGSERPGELVGHGPIDADTARALAADSVIERLLTDPATGTVLEHGRTRYTPPAALADHIRSRDQICRGPRCTRRVRDLDHHQDWALHGDTDWRNLYGYCKHCHLLKDAPGWQVITDPDDPHSDITWISPCGRRTVSRPYDYRDFTDDLPTATATATATATQPAATSRNTSSTRSAADNGTGSRTDDGTGQDGDARPGADTGRGTGGRPGPGPGLDRFGSGPDGDDDDDPPPF